MVPCNGKLFATNAHPIQICPEYIPWYWQQYCRQGSDYRHPYVRSIKWMGACWKVEFANMQHGSNTFALTESELKEIFPNTWQILRMIAK